MKTWNEKFKAIVDEKQIDVRDLAYMFEVSPSTIERWLAGEAAPGDKVQEFALKELNTWSLFD